MKKKSILLTTVMMLMMSLFLIGCGAKTDGDKAKDSGGGNEGGNTQDTLIFGRGGDSVGLDPITVTDGESFIVTKNVFEQLVEFGQGNTEVEPALATEWEISPDGLTYTFKLREGVKFHDGTDFNADAVVFNFDRWMNGTADKFPYYISMFGGFKGDEGHVIKEVKAVDEYTVQFTLNRPQAPFLKNLAMVPFAIASPDAVKKHGDKFTENPVGTGPFKFVEWKRNDKVVLEKNEDYWKEGQPKLKQVIIRVIPENSARLSAVKTGEVDLADGINPSDVKQVEGNPDMQVFERPSMNVGYLGMTATRKPFDNVKVRQAINHAINKQALVDAFYEGKGEVAKNPMPPVISGYNDDIQGYEYSPEKAKQLLAEAGYPDGFEMELWAMPVPRPYMPDGKKIAEAIQADLEAVGVKAKIVSYEWATYLEKASKGEADAFLLGWTGDNGDADNFLYALLDKDAIGSNNYTYYSNDELHEVLVQAQTEVDEAKRNELYKKAQEIIFADAPWVPLAHSTPVLVGKSNIQNFFPHPTGTDRFDELEFK